MSTGAVSVGGAVVATAVGAVVSGGTLVGTGTVVVVLVVVLVVVVSLSSGGSPSASIGVTPSSAGRLHAPSKIAKANSPPMPRRVRRSIMRPPLAGGRRIGRRPLDGP